MQEMTMDEVDMVNGGRMSASELALGIGLAIVVILML